MNKNYLRALALLLFLSSSFNAHAWGFSLSCLRPSFSMPGKRYVNAFTGFLCSAPIAFFSALNDLRHLSQMREQAENLQKETGGLAERLAELGRQRAAQAVRLAAVAKAQGEIRDGLVAIPGKIEGVEEAQQELLAQRQRELEEQLRANARVVDEKIGGLAEQQQRTGAAFAEHEEKTAAAIARGQEQVSGRLAGIDARLAAQEQENAATIAAAQAVMEANQRKREKLAGRAAGIAALLQAKREQDAEGLRGLSSEVDRLTGMFDQLGKRHQAMQRQLQLAGQSKGLLAANELGGPGARSALAGVGSLAELD